MPAPAEGHANGTAAVPAASAAAVGSGVASSAAAGDAREANQLAWLPPSAASISLRLAALDAALVYRDGEKPWRDSAPVRIKLS